MEKMGKDAEELSVNPQEYQEIFKNLSSGKYFSALRYVSDSQIPQVSGEINTMVNSILQC
jgi:hypothetical protein